MDGIDLNRPANRVRTASGSNRILPSIWRSARPFLYGFLLVEIMIRSLPLAVLTREMLFTFERRFQIKRRTD